MNEESEVSIGRPDENLALSKFKEAIEKQAKEQTDTIFTEARAKADEIIEKSKKEIAQLRSEIITKAENEAKIVKVFELYILSRKDNKGRIKLSDIICFVFLYSPRPFSGCTNGGASDEDENGDQTVGCSFGGRSRC